MLRLHDYARSSACYRVRIALNLKRVGYETVVVDLLAGDQRGDAYRALNPQGLVPALEADGAVIVQSLAIIDWLDRRFPDPPLLPPEPAARARAHAQALIIACDIHPLNNLRVLQRLKHGFAADDTARTDWMAHWMAEGFAALEAIAGDAPFLAGARPGLPDLCLVPQLYNARRWGVPLDAYPLLTAIDARLADEPAFAAAHPDRAG